MKRPHESETPQAQQANPSKHDKSAPSKLKNWLRCLKFRTKKQCNTLKQILKRCYLLMANRCELTGEYWLSKKQMVQIYHVSIAFGPSPKRKNIHVSSPFYCWELNYIVYRSVSYIPSKNQPVFLQPLVGTLFLGKPRKRLSGAHVLRLPRPVVWVASDPLKMHARKPTQQQPRLPAPSMNCSVYPFIPYQLLFRQLVEQSVWQT